MGSTVFLARLLAGAVIAGLVLTGCASGAATSAGSAAPGASSASADGQQNDADVSFVQGMIPHHRQAVEMADLVAGRSENAGVIDLAARIGSGQQPEIDTMTGWLQQWGAEVPSDGGGMGGMGRMDHGGMGGAGGMDGMMTPEQMQGLTTASGPAFDRIFLELMAEHHRGAVEMAQVELQDGADPGALALAQTIIDTQQDEIAEMETLLKQV